MKLQLQTKTYVAGLAVALVCWAGPGSAASQCAHPAGDYGCFDTIQAAVNAAGAGDTVSVYGGVYLENVVVPAGKDALILAAVPPGKKGPNAIIDADHPNTGDGLTIESSDVTVRGLHFRNGDDDAIVIRAPFAHIDSVNIQNPQDDCIHIENDATDAVIENSFLANCDEAVYSFYISLAHRTEFLNNEVHICDSGCIDLSGDDIVVRGNRISQPEDGDCIEGDGNGWTVEGNELRNCADEGVDIYGDDALIADNNIHVCEGDGIDASGNDVVIRNNVITAVDEHGIDVYGENPRVTDNEVSGTMRDGIYVYCAWDCASALVAGNVAELAADDDAAFDIGASAPGMVVENNTGRYSADEGFSIRTSTDSSDTIIVRNNLAFGNGGDQYEEGFYIYGKGHQVIGNTARNNSTGFEIDGSEILVQGNVAKDNYADGFVINGTDNTVSDNLSKNHNGEGIEITAGALNTVVTGNTSKENLRADFCDFGANTNVYDNNFDSVGPCVVDP